MKQRKCNQCGRDDRYYAKGLCRLCYNKMRYETVQKVDPNYLNSKKDSGRRYYQENRIYILTRQKQIREINGDLIRERVKISQRKHRKILKESGDYSNEYLFGGNKKKVYERDEYCCQSCGLSNDLSIKMYGLNLLIHHIDGMGSKYPPKERNNKMDNLVTLCIPCHKKEHSRWKHNLPHKTILDFLS